MRLIIPAALCGLAACTALPPAAPAPAGSPLPPQRIETELNAHNQQIGQLQQQVANSGVQVNRVNESTIQLNIQSEVLFDTDQSVIKPNFYQPLGSIAQTLQQYPETIVHVYGFTDGSGSPQHNMQLSQRRAQSVAQYLSQQGINSQRFVVQGYGEQYATAEKNPQDRRVAIYIKAIDQANPQAAYQPVF